MFCPNCGASNAETATVCAQCNQPIPQFSSTPQPVPPPQPPVAPTPGVVAPGPGQPAAQIPNYLTQSIVLLIVSVVCCGNLLSMGLAIVALVFSTQVNSKVAVNDIAGAWSASKNAKLLNWIALAFLIAEVLFIILYVILIALGVATNVFQQR